MYDKQIEDLINAALADGVLTEKEKQILFKKAESLGIDLDEFEMVLDARLVEFNKAEEERKRNHELEMAKIRATAQKSAPKSDKFGDVRKCPACGAIVQPYVGVCPECGHEFINVGVTKSAEKLAKLLRDAKEQRDIEHILETFPVPNTKADLLEILFTMRQRMVRRKWYDPYWKKYVECIKKSEISFKEDKMFAPYFETYNENIKLINEQFRAEKKYERKKKNRNRITVAILFFIGLALFIYMYTLIGGWAWLVLPVIVVVLFFVWMVVHAFFIY